VRGSPQRVSTSIATVCAGPEPPRQTYPAPAVINGYHDGQGQPVLGQFRTLTPLVRAMRRFLPPRRSERRRRVLERSQPDLAILPPLASLHGLDSHPHRVTTRPPCPQSISSSALILHTWPVHHRPPCP